MVPYILVLGSNIVYNVRIMLNLSVVFNCKELWSVGYGSMVFYDNDQWYFGGTEDE